MRDYDLATKSQLVQVAILLCEVADLKPTAFRINATLKGLLGKGLRQSDLCTILRTVLGPKYQGGPDGSE